MLGASFTVVIVRVNKDLYHLLIWYMYNTNHDMIGLSSHNAIDHLSLKP